MLTLLKPCATFALRLCIVGNHGDRRADAHRHSHVRALREHVYMCMALCSRLNTVHDMNPSMPVQRRAEVR